MTRSQVDFAERKAKQLFDKWNEVTGAYPVGTSYYDEICGTIEDAVHVGIQMAMFGDVEIIDGEIVKERIITTKP